VFLKEDACSEISKTDSPEIRQYLLYWQFLHCKLPSLIATKMYFSSMCAIKNIILEYI
jgi:hypothetical protein